MGRTTGGLAMRGARRFDSVRNTLAVAVVVTCSGAFGFGQGVAMSKAQQQPDRTTSETGRVGTVQSNRATDRMMQLVTVTPVSEAQMPWLVTATPESTDEETWLVTVTPADVEQRPWLATVTPEPSEPRVEMAALHLPVAFRASNAP